MRVILIWVCMLLLPACVEAASIGIFSTPDCTSCKLGVGAGEQATFYVNARPEPFDPITGAEFRIVGLPREWVVQSLTPNPEIYIRVGNPLRDGTNISFAKSQPGNCVNLFTIQVLATGFRSDVVLRIGPHATPTSRNHQCPVIVFDCNCFPVVCAGGGQLLVNSSRDCSVGVQPTTWERVRRLYR